MASNELSSLPECLCQLTQLHELNISGNQLSALPEFLCQLTQIRELNLSGNKFSSLPRWLSQYERLERLYLHGNDALGLPIEILGPTSLEVLNDKKAPLKPPEILGYYFRVLEEKRPLNEAKLILVGYGAVGKTSLVNRLVHSTFEGNEKKTEGIQITQWPIQLNGKENVRLNVWDFGGQEIMHSTHQFFLTKRSLYLIVLNGRQGHEDADVEYWMSLVKGFGGDSPVIVVLNKFKEHHFDLNRRALIQKYPIIQGFIETDCEDNTGVDKLRKIIERETDRMEHLRDPFPASWFSIKDRLAGMGENILTFDKYREICSENGESNQGAQGSLSVYLHNLGIALNYKDDPRLRDCHVLNPHWVTNGIYSLLNAEVIARQKGELSVADLVKILDQTVYPLERHNFLLELMRKFELCFGFPEREGYYLIPELLDKQQPAEAGEFDPARNLNFQYHYPVLPEGLLPRFIVRSHVLSTNLPRWRSGVILEFEGSRALVKADVQDKRISILVSGPTIGRRRLLAIIRSDFEYIHRNYKFNPQEMVAVPDHPQTLIPYRKLWVMEEEGIYEYPEVVGNEVLKIDVQELLNGFDLEKTRKTEKGSEMDRRGVRLFYSYSHKDESLREELETHLKLLQRQGMIDVWHDRRILPGEDWKDSIDENLEKADIVLLLVSADFIASDYCYDIEMGRALARHKAGEAEVIPVILRKVAWGKAPFSKLQALPKDGKAITLWPDRDSAWCNVAEGIESVLDKFKK